LYVSRSPVILATIAASAAGKVWRVRGCGTRVQGSRRMSRLLPIAAVLALIVGCVPPPMTALASPIVAQSADAPAGSTPPSTATPPGPPKARPSAVVLTFENADIEMVTQVVSEIVGFDYIGRLHRARVAAA